VAGFDIGDEPLGSFIIVLVFQSIYLIQEYFLFCYVEQSEALQVEVDQEIFHWHCGSSYG
jgi:hypothetical protein